MGALGFRIHSAGTGVRWWRDAARRAEAGGRGCGAQECINRTRAVVAEPFGRCSYTEAIELLQKSVKEGKTFEDMNIFWGDGHGLRARALPLRGPRDAPCTHRDQKDAHAVQTQKIDTREAHATEHEARGR